MINLSGLCVIDSLIMIIRGPEEVVAMLGIYSSKLIKPTPDMIDCCSCDMAQALINSERRDVVYRAYCAYQTRR
jgi:hypothetical protein